MSRYLEDFTAGQTFKHWPGRTVTEFDNTWFTLMTLNTNPLHFDAAFAAKSQHGQRLVNGLLVIAMVVGMTVRDISENAIANLEYESIRHSGPTFHGDTLVRGNYRAVGDAVADQVGSGRGVRRDPRPEPGRQRGADPAPQGADSAPPRGDVVMLLRRLSERLSRPDSRCRRK